MFREGRQGIGAEAVPGTKTLQRRESLAVKVKKKLANARRKKRERDDTPQQPNNTLNNTEEESKESIALKSQKRKLERPIFEKTTPKRKRQCLTNDHNKPLNISLNGLRYTHSERHIDTRDLIIATNGGQGGKVLNGDSLQTSSKVRQNTTA